MSSEQRLWLEASTFSNRGEMRQHLPTDYGIHPNSWLEASTKAHCSQLIAHWGAGFHAKP